MRATEFAHITSRNEAESIEAINDLLAKENDPFKRRVLRSLKDTAPGLGAALQRELGGMPAQDIPDFAASLSHSLLETICATATRGDERLSAILQKHIVMVILQELTGRAR